MSFSQLRGSDAEQTEKCLGGSKICWLCKLTEIESYYSAKSQTRSEPVTQLISKVLRPSMFTPLLSLTCIIKTDLAQLYHCVRDCLSKSGCHTAFTRGSVCVFLFAVSSLLSGPLTSRTTSEFPENCFCALKQAVTQDNFNLSS